MRGDLNDQFQRAQAASGSTGPSKWLIALIVGMLVCFTLIMVAGTVFIVKTLDKFVEAEPTADSGSGYSADGEIDPFSPSGYSGGSSSTLTGSSDYSSITSNFKYGTVTGTSYYSQFSGVSFEAPSDWNVTSYSDSQFQNLLSPKDLSASSSDLSVNVSISYEAMQSHFYTTASDALKTYINTATTGTNNSMVNDNVTASYGGNSFTGIIYKKTMDAYYSYYTEVIVTEVNGYVLEIYVEANSEAELSAVMQMFS